jgi:hypothetical protein
MWADVLNNPKQGQAFRRDRGQLTNCPVNYDDAAERSRTHPKLLAFENESGTSSERTKATLTHRRSVLVGERVPAGTHESRQ